MRRQITRLLKSLLFTNCNNASKEDAKSENILPDKVDSTKIAEPDEEIITKTKYLKDFLLEPINLIDFKSKYGPSNSGGCCSGNPKEWMYKPEKEGFYYQYMLFRKLNEMQLANGKVMNETEQFRKFQIYVYHFGKNKEFDFFSDNEVLIGFSCAGIHEALGRANIVGKSFQEIEELFGNEFIDCDSIKIYQHDNRVISLKFKSSKVEWIKYFHQSSRVEKEKIPEHLIRFN